MNAPADFDPVRTPSAESETCRPILGSARQEIALPILIFLLSFAYLLIFRRYTTLEPDEGIVLQGAERIMRGEVPYRDFFSFYTPGSFYLLAFLFRIFGDSFSVARTSLAAVGASCSVITYLLAARVCRRDIAIFVALLATTSGAAFRFLVLHNPYSTLLSCLAIYAAVRLLETQRLVWAFTVGSIASLTFLFEQSKGTGLCLGLGLGFLILWWVRTSPLHRSHVTALAVGLAWPLGLTFGYFGKLHATKLMVQDWIWPLQHYAQANRVPYGYQNWSENSRDTIFRTGPFWIRVLKTLTVSANLILPVLPLIALSALLYCARAGRQPAVISREIRYYVLVCSALCGLLWSVVVVRPDILHFVYLAPLWYLVLAWILGARAVTNRVLQAVRPGLTAYVGAAFGLLSLALLFSVTGAHYRVATRRGPIHTGEKDTVIDYVQARLGEGQRLLVYPYLPLYNYLTATRSPSPYDYFQPGMNTPEQGREIIAALESQKQPAVLYEPWFQEKIANSWPKTSLRAIATDSVADYIVRNYRVCQMLNSPDGWRFQYMVPKETMCPATGYH